MPITIDLPTPTQPIGPGITVVASLDPNLFVERDQLAVTLQDGAETQRVIGFGAALELHQPFSNQVVIGKTQQNPDRWQAYPQFPTMTHGGTVRVVWQHRDATATVKDQVVTSHTYDTVTGLQVVLPGLIQATSGGYTDADRSVASATLANTATTFASGIAGVPDAILGIGKLFTSPPVEILRRAELLVLEGRGQLWYPAAGTEVQAYGALVGFDHLPPGIGFRDGYIREYEVRVGQFVVYGRHGNTVTYVKFLEDLNSVGQYLLWGAPFPRTIGYDITPGIRLTWQWLVLGVQA